jgi:HTH-type transcriptional repressor of NAD biosynthesis genes
MELVEGVPSLFSMSNNKYLICLYGPESTGKSIMAQHLAEKYRTEFVPEVAKEFINSNNFTDNDIIKIGHAQTNRIKEKLKTANRFLFCDTDLITTQIYSRHYLGVVPPVLFELEKEIQYDHYFLFDIDVPWVSDGLRDLGERRKEMMKIFQLELKKRKIVPTRVTGNWIHREEIITQYLESLERQG